MAPAGNRPPPPPPRQEARQEECEGRRALADLALVVLVIGCVALYLVFYGV